jgi:hypothetical protein
LTIQASIIVPHNVSSILYDPSSHSVIPIPSQDHGESFMECRLQNHTDSSDPEMMDQDPFFIASFLEACILFDPGGDVATLPTCDIKNVGVQYDTVNVIDLEWICQDPFGIKT